MLKFYTETMYSIWVGSDNDWYHFARQSLINMDIPLAEQLGMSNDVMYGGSIYKMFYTLFPILEYIKKENISIGKCWTTQHPFNTDDEIPLNKYNKFDDNIFTSHLKQWAMQKNISFIENCLIFDYSI
jgi:hypothetical protein